MSLEESYKILRKGAEVLALQNAQTKNRVLKIVKEALDKNRQKILAENAKDVKRARDAGVKDSLVDRLSLDDKKINGILESMDVVIAQTDPIGEEVAGWKTPNGLCIRQVRVPIGVVGIIYESRPNVTVDAFCLAYKSGNSILLRGSSSAYASNRAIVDVIKEALDKAEGGVPDAIELVETKEGDHSDVDAILNAVGKIDVVLPRGGKKLIQNVVQNARVPVIETGSGVCHLYVDESADLEMAVTIAENAKIQRPGVCNAIECILVNRKVAEDFLERLVERFAGRVTFHADPEALTILKEAALREAIAQNAEEGSSGKNPATKILAAREEDFGNEYLDYECCVKIVDDVNEAISYINAHNTKHSESIITQDMKNARLFQSKVDAACVYVNASTRFTDGGEFGFGAELGISTQKLHARGPMGIKALTTTKYLIEGEGQIR
ncbi:MAG: glutamate-5-semialdehyde dehydrogenase [Treponema sp.]|nr:glutamate-5-semialdehyde dehydrogenase [Treponema sp.]